MQACVPCFGGNRHGGGGEILHLLKLEVEVFGENSQLCHVFGGAAGVRTDEVGDDLLAQFLAAVDVVEDTLEVVEELEGRFSHEIEHPVGCVFWGNFQPSAYMLGNQFFCVLAVDAVDACIACIVQQEVVANP